MLGMSLTVGICLIFKNLGEICLVLGEGTLFTVIWPPRNEEHFRKGKNGLKKKNCAKLLCKIMLSDRVFLVP
jgi:hypothetical protein